MKAIARITLNKVTYIQDDEFAGFHLYSSIKDGLTYGHFTIFDREGTLFAKFENLQIGTRVLVEIVSTDTSSPVVIYPYFYILKIENHCETNPGILAGGIKVWFGHPWLLYKDVKNHAYKPMNNGELIKKILKNEDRGLEIKVIDDNFDKTDDKGIIARYKICETDWDFIQNKVIPYTAIKQTPAHFFSNDMGEFYLRSFANLYKENPKFIFKQNEELSNQFAKQISKLCDDFGIDKNKGHLPVKEIYFKIGNEDILKEMYPSFFLENNVQGKFIAGAKKLANKVSKRSGTQFGNKLPIDDAFFDKLKGTSIKVIHNRQINDAMSLIFETGKYVDNMFSIEIVTTFNGHSLHPGNTAQLFVGDIKHTPDGDPKKHWAGGKWLVSEIEHYSDEEDPKLFLSRTTLMRPAFVGDDEKTSLSMPVMMYETPE
jgi:hypothetical protein